MNQHVRLQPVKPRAQLIDLGDRSAIVQCMAEHLVAAILTDGLDTSSDIDVIDTLYNTPERFASRVVLDHMDDAKAEALQILIAREMGDA